MGQVFQFPTGELSPKDQAIEDYRLARERIAVVAYAEARRLYSDPRAVAALDSGADFEAAVGGVARILLLDTYEIVTDESDVENSTHDSRRSLSSERKFRRTQQTICSVAAQEKNSVSCALSFRPPALSRGLFSS